MAFPKRFSLNFAKSMPFAPPIFYLNAIFLSKCNQFQAILPDKA